MYLRNLGSSLRNIFHKHNINLPFIILGAYLLYYGLHGSIVREFSNLKKDLMITWFLLGILLIWISILDSRLRELQEKIDKKD